MALSVFDKIGGKRALEFVHKIFYIKVFEHPWLGQYFEDIDREFLESQQTDFMMGALGGPKVYSGAVPKHAHKHMFITRELFDLRHELLRQSLVEAGIPERPAEQWLRVDRAFASTMVKTSVTECQRRYANEPVVAVPKPWAA